MRKIVIAIPKERRLFKKSCEYFRKIGLTSTSMVECVNKNINSKLEFETNNKEAIFLLVRSRDIPHYINNGWANMGISTCDYFNEYRLDKNSLNSICANVLLSKDLGFFEKSRLCFAGNSKNKNHYFDLASSSKKLIIATEYVNICRNYFNRRNVNVDIIKIGGSLELMPKYAHADAILDIVESGKTLHNNSLVIYEELMKISTNVLVNKKFIKENKNAIFARMNIADYFSKKIGVFHDYSY